MNPLLAYFIGSFISLASIVNPLMAAPIFVTLTTQMDAKERRHVAWKSTLNVLIILLLFFVAGSLILSFFGISIHALRIAGGIMILNSAFGMLNKRDRLSPDEQKEAEDKEGIAFSPLAMPLMSGPGAIAVLIGMTADATSPAHYPLILLIILLVSLGCYITLRGSHFLMDKLGPTLMKAFTRMMGFILLCVGVQFMVNGIQGVVLDLWPLLSTQLSNSKG
ncbi:MAG: MarC family NAAT transporter [Vampirovibrio sp.]|nr:MarC family NAAT transporter [Vampirovibrio sp.]